MARRSPGGVGDGLPQTPSGEPLLARWFVLAMIGLSVVAVVLTVVALTTRTAPPAEELPPAARRNPGTDTVTHLRGQALLAETRDVETGVACAPDVRLVGDAGGRSTVRRALETLCSVLARDDGTLDVVADGLDVLNIDQGIIRVSLAAATGQDSSARIEDAGLVVELAPKFQFDNATEAAPFLAHELAHIGGDRWPGAPVDVVDELVALEAQLAVCEALLLGDDRPRGCDDAEAVLTGADPSEALREAGYPE